MSERSLAEWLSYLEGLHPNAIDLGLERVREVAQRMGLARPARQVVTVTGTNGKGSTCAFIATMARTQGLRVGVYSSPHLLRYNERVLLDGREADDSELCAAFAVVEQARGEISLTYFEVGTLAALWLFERSQLDLAVLEVGLGGRLDAVNLVDSDLALVTNVGLDHADWLGDSRESVAYEKAGIFRPGKPALCGDTDPPQPLLEQARQLASPLFLRGRDYSLSISPNAAANHWQWRGVDNQGQPLLLEALPMLNLPLENAALALQAYALLGLPWEAAALAAALADTRVVGRFDRREITAGGRPVSLVMDVGHNPHAAAYLAARLAQCPCSGRRHAVFGLLADKDLEGVIGPLLPLFASWSVAPLPTPRSRPAEQLREALLVHGAPVSVHGSIAEALDAVCDGLQAGDEIVLFGSFYCVSEALEWLN
ncbi:bifunctional tetrahydrofolate synthase/dihydrofolate synthase [Stutzerimonas kirkiae]|uniref:Dihydrofolate synthase/folylpolyglutamate synthase n=1 Tax=Stutzerimonas kirkiae TaxID=2211392 RepID=A0A4Q9R9B2_9GAMM|nr:bifunctional tetrahydrofolate synthase/dihydrofolate synthase [Stutzerimonas kirkiae]TBU97268.1 bifunctional tetrahydrofolate synthase/dihydrofolate synthase [Stutzerimonas kirkiae]TBV03691.1 bifunctional tetrahydrofolate synthase/dihydrofolate synthase [Stutzerimonas kirkiae]TBV11315.1 bifunctional tetrahydrofolate synthase/dihydrofolate synthase [Stutzerimonas kirkiae]TBV13436.1 bifunctional tetrahydrofolate synthase/dihydrofolate synthase [Stutzerimonas kirkiae]